MFENIKKILEKAKETGKDIGVAYDMLSVADKSEELKEASKFLNENQTEILKLHNAGRNIEIKIMCQLKENPEKLRMYVAELYNEGVIER
jgi:hypothetical protein